VRDQRSRKAEAAGQATHYRELLEKVL